MASRIADIHFIDGQYFNWNGRNPDKPLSIPYAKRLLSHQKRYGDLVDTKTASGHGDFRKKKKDYDTLAYGKEKKVFKKSIKQLDKINKKDLFEGIRNKTIDTKNLRTRFRAGFRPYDIDDEGNVLESYQSITRSKALDGVIPIERFLKDLPDEVFQENTRGGFKIAVYDKYTHHVHYSFEYGEQD